MKRYQCNEFGVPNQRPCPPAGCCCPPPCPPSCPPPCPPPCPPVCQPYGFVPVPFVLGNTYCAGQLVTYEGCLYLVNINCPRGIPGESDDFTTLSCWGGPTGPTGPVGPTGPTGTPGPVGPTGSTDTKIDAQQGVKKKGKKESFGALLMQIIPYNIQTYLYVFLSRHGWNDSGG